MKTQPDTNQAMDTNVAVASVAGLLLCALLAYLAAVYHDTHPH